MHSPSANIDSNNTSTTDSLLDPYHPTTLTTLYPSSYRLENAAALLPLTLQTSKNYQTNLSRTCFDINNLRVIGMLVAATGLVITSIYNDTNNNWHAEVMRDIPQPALKFAFLCSALAKLKPLNANYNRRTKSIILASLLFSTSIAFNVLEQKELYRFWCLSKIAFAAGLAIWAELTVHELKASKFFNSFISLLLRLAALSQLASCGLAITEASTGKAFGYDQYINSLTSGALSFIYAAMLTVALKSYGKISTNFIPISTLTFFLGCSAALVYLANNIFTITRESIQPCLLLGAVTIASLAEYCLYKSLSFEISNQYQDPMSSSSERDALLIGASGQKQIANPNNINLAIN